jgi:hypothetical protein
MFLSLAFYLGSHGTYKSYTGMEYAVPYIPRSPRRVGFFNQRTVCCFCVTRGGENWVIKPERLDLAANRADPSQKSNAMRSLSKDLLQELQEELFWETCEDKCEPQNLLARPSPTFIARSKNRQDRVLAPPPWLVPALSGC